MDRELIACLAETKREEGKHRESLACPVETIGEHGKNDFEFHEF